MAITIDNKTYRNLEEQVLKNKEDIAKHYAVDRVIADWGIKVLGVVPAVEDIPVATYEYGDAFGLSSTSPMQYVVWTRANANVGEATDYWLNIGALSLVGPQGPQGPQGNPGPTGKRGSLWTSTSGGPNVVGANFLNGDLWLNAANGDVYQYIADDQRWSLKGNIRGPQGVQGPTGPKGEQGIQGPTGPQGPKGDTGSSFKIGGLLESVDNLPTPTEANRSVGYAIKNADGVTYDLYVVVGTDNLQWVNMGRVEGVEGPQGPQGPQGPAGVGATIIPISSSSKGGTLNPTQLQTIRTATYPIINLNNEYFVKADIYDSENEFVFSHVGNREGALYNKTFTLNTASGNWTLKEVIVQEIIDITNWFSDVWSGVVPEEYRNIELLKKSILIKDNNAFKYTSGPATNEEFWPLWSCVDADIEVSALYCASIRMYESWELEFFGFQEIVVTNIASSTQIIEDRGELEIATYNDGGQIIDINNSPNIYLQRRLTTTPEVQLDSQSVKQWLDENYDMIKVGTIVRIYDPNEEYFASLINNGGEYFIIVDKQNSSTAKTYYLKPLTPVIDINHEYQIIELVIAITNNVVRTKKLVPGSGIEDNPLVSSITFTRFDIY